MQDITEQQEVAQEISDAISKPVGFGEEFDEVRSGPFCFTGDQGQGNLYYPRGAICCTTSSQYKITPNNTQIIHGKQRTISTI